MMSAFRTSFSSYSLMEGGTGEQSNKAVRLKLEQADKDMKGETSEHDSEMAEDTSMKMNGRSVLM